MAKEIYVKITKSVPIFTIVKEMGDLDKKFHLETCKQILSYIKEDVIFLTDDFKNDLDNWSIIYYEEEFTTIPNKYLVKIPVEAI